MSSVEPQGDDNTGRQVGGDSSPSENIPTGPAGNAGTVVNWMLSQASAGRKHIETQLSNAYHPEGGGKKDQTARIQGSSLLPENVSKDIEILAELEDDEDLKRILRPASRISAPDNKVVPREALLNYIEDKITRKRECLNVPFIILYFVVYGILLLVHERVPDVSQLEREFRGMLEGTSFEGYESIPGHPVSGHKTMDDIDTVADVYTYLKEAVVPLFIHDINNTAEEDVYRVLSYSNLIGGVTVEQARKMRINCAEYYPNKGPFNEEGRNPFLDQFDCFPDVISDRCFGPGDAVEGFCPSKEDSISDTAARLRLRRLSAKKPRYSSMAKRLAPRLSKRVSGFGKRIQKTVSAVGSRFTGRRLSRQARAAKSKSSRSSKAVSDRPGDVFVVELHSHEGLQRVLERVQELQDNYWIDLQTAWIGIKLFVLNPDVGLYTSVVVNLYFAPSGEIAPLVEATTFVAEPYQHQWIIFFDVLWALMWVQLTWATSRSFYMVYRSHVRKKMCDYFTDIFNLVEWMCTICGFGVLCMFSVYFTGLMELRDIALQVTLKRPAAGVFVDDTVLEEYHNLLRDLRSEVVAFDSFIQAYRTALSWYCVLLIFRFFKAFMAQPKLAVVTRTILSCAPDFFHFFIVMFTALISFAVSGMFLFGHRLIHFASLDLAIEAVLLFSLGNMDWEELADEWPLAALFWQVVFMIFMFILILNMALAIIMDVYGAQVTESAVKDSLLDQGGNLIQDMRGKYGVSNEQLLRQVEAITDNQITKQRLAEATCEALDEKAATKLIDKVNDIVTNDDINVLNLSDAARLMVAIKNTAYAMADQINEITVSQRLTRQVCAQQKRVRDRIHEATGYQICSVDPLPIIELQLDDRSELRLRAIEARMSVIEEFLNEAFSYIVFRGKEGRNKLKEMEEVLRGQRDHASSADMWDARFAKKSEENRAARGLQTMEAEPAAPVLTFTA